MRQKRTICLHELHMIKLLHNKEKLSFIYEHSKMKEYFFFCEKKMKEFLNAAWQKKKKSLAFLSARISSFICLQTKIYSLFYKDHASAKANFDQAGR